MKKNVLLIFFAIVSFSLMQSCKKDDKSDENTDAITQEDAELIVKSSVETEGLLDMLDVYGFDSTSNNRTPGLPSCVTQTVVTNANTVTITWEFDTNGCTLPNGNTYRGTVVVIKTHDPANQTVSGSISFDQFYVNNTQIEGSSNFERVLSNANGNPQITHNYNFTITFSNGDFAERSGTHIREWIEGFSTPVFDDNVFLITGNAHYRFRNGNEVDVVVTTPLRREATCPYFVSGVLDISRNNHHAVLDFGNGTCDNEATLTLSNGTVYVINLD